MNSYIEIEEQVEDNLAETNVMWRALLKEGDQSQLNPTIRGVAGGFMRHCHY